MSIEVTIVGGYLGSGKSSLVNHLLRSSRKSEIGVIINDLAPVNVDAEYVIGEAGLSLGIQDGCACCAITDRLGEAFERMSAFRPPLKRIIVEASGVGDPYRLSYYSRGIRGLDLGAVITVVDATTVAERLQDKYVERLVRRQIEAADYLVISKLDIAPAGCRAHVETLLRDINPDASTMYARHGVVDPGTVLQKPVMPVATRRAPQAFPPAQDMGNASGGEGEFSTMVLRTEMRLDAKKIFQSLQELACIAERIKGVVITADGADNQFLVQVAGGDVQITPAPSSSVYAGSVLVFVLSGNKAALNEYQTTIEHSLPRDVWRVGLAVGQF